MVRALASHGYTVMAVDLYTGQVATTADGARKLMLSFDEQKGMFNIDAAVNILKLGYNATKISTIDGILGEVSH